MKGSSPVISTGGIGREKKENYGHYLTEFLLILMFFIKKKLNA
jgi:hypothetical protein